MLAPTPSPALPRTLSVPPRISLPSQAPQSPITRSWPARMPGADVMQARTCAVNLEFVATDPAVDVEQIPERSFALSMAQLQAP